MVGKEGWPMRGRDLVMWSDDQWEPSKKNYMKRGHHSKKQTFKHTSRLLDQLGPEGRVGENWLPSFKKKRKIFRARFENTMGNYFFDFGKYRPNLPKKSWNSNYVVLYEKNAFRFNFGPREVPQLENAWKWKCILYIFLTWHLRESQCCPVVRFWCLWIVLTDQGLPSQTRPAVQWRPQEIWHWDRPRVSSLLGRP